ncbi:TonB-dependent receptor [Psychroflexus sp. CAK57W]|uniref:TonB-dependent receptor domain-containing protein n=1 Tax=Psychroflexus curvus TaxID=2873595 RepID=UPI001CCE33E9|nr:TonB-dependent receptor [Psychroflexus curvus]MBZ9627901.1 TonB-dependent receptor [Psychroflexus curvus]MBZ9787578.1 TonB-dependent receptor [Psychroflexus curvus]
MKFILSAISLLATSIMLIAQTKSIEVKDAQTKETLTGVYAIDQNNKEDYRITENKILKLEIGKTYRVSHIGYSSQVLKIKSSTPEVVFLEAQNTELAEVLVTGKIFQDPVMNITTPDLTERVSQPKNVADLFRDINGFGLIKRGNYAIDPSFRASQYEQLNIQYDGGTKVMNACPNRMDPITTHVMPEDIAKIEVVRGPYTMRYGATFGGLINMVSKRPELGKYGFSGSASTGYETNGNSMVNMVRLQYAEEKFDVVGMYGYRDFGNYEDGAGREIPSSFRSIDYSLRLGYNFASLERLQLHWRQSYGRDVLHASLPMDSDYDDSSMLSLDYFKKNPGKTLQKIQAKAYYSYVDHLMSNSRRSNFSTVEALSPVEATTAGGRFELEWKLDEFWTLFTGTDALLISRDGTRNRLIKLNMMGMSINPPIELTDKIWQESFINDYGFFAESRYRLNTSTVLSAGIRYDVVNSDIQDPASDFQDYYPGLGNRTEHNFSGTLSLKKLLDADNQLEFAFGRGVRSANMIERFINHFQVGQDPFEYIGNPNLDAEVNNQFEVAYTGKKTMDGPVDRLDWGASVYFSQFENYIVAIIDPTKTRKFMPNQEPLNPKVFRNLDDAYKTGFEANLGVNFFNNFQFDAEAAYVYARNEDLNESLPLTPPLRSKLSLQYNKNKFWIATDLRVVSQQDELATSFGENQATPGYELVDFRLGYELLPDLNLGGAVLNAFDQQYYDHLNFAFRNQANASLSGMERLTDPGQNFTVFVKYEF